MGVSDLKELFSKLKKLGEVALGSTGNDRNT